MNIHNHKFLCLFYLQESGEFESGYETNRPDYSSLPKEDIRRRIEEFNSNNTNHGLLMEMVRKKTSHTFISVSMHERIVKLSWHVFGEVLSMCSSLQLTTLTSPRAGHRNFPKKLRFSKPTGTETTFLKSKGW
jgi:hypothetical protein